MSVNDISSISNVSDLKNAIDISVTKLSKDSIIQTGKDLVDMMKKSNAKMEHSVRPHVGGNIDISC